MRSRKAPGYGTIAPIASLCALLFALMVSSSNALAARTTRYVYLNDTIGQPGTQDVEEADDGLVTVRYIYKNNGRGPELTESFRLAADGSFSEYHVTGKSTLGAPVDEHFTRQGDSARWWSTSERGSATVTGAALYVPLMSSMAPTSVAITALAQRKDGRIALLPSGSLSQRQVDEVEVLGADGSKRRVQLLVQTGLGLQPTFVWASRERSLDGLGTVLRLFAYDAFWGEIFIEDGWQANRALLEKHQQVAERAVLAEIAGRLRKPLNGLTVVRNARVFDSVAGKLGTPSDIYVLRGRITAMLPAGSTAREADTEIDAAGRVLLPGLFDSHAHVDRWYGSLDLSFGVTTVRDMGNDNRNLQRLLDDTAAGAVLSPQIVPCGFLEGRSPFSASQGFTISTLAEARDAVDWYAQRGYPQLKIYNSFPKEILRETVAYAHSRGMRVSGHVPVFMRAGEVVEQGFDEIQHINQVLLHFLVKPDTDTRTPERFRLPADQLADFDFDAAPVQDFIKMLAARKTVIDPTLATFDFIQQRDGEVSRPYAAVVSHLPPDVQRWLYVGGLPIPDDSTAQRYRKSYAKMVDFVGRLYRAGVPIIAGTDSFPGFVLAGELDLYVQAGLTPAQALQTATLEGARYSGTLAERGSIVVGKLADLVLVDGDPTRDIADVRKVALVITQGHWLSPREIHNELGIQPFVASTPTVRRLRSESVTLDGGVGRGAAQGTRLKTD